MKTSTLIFATLLSATACFSQDTSADDIALSSSVIGRWEHVSSTYPGGDVVTYQREIYFYNDGSGMCTKYMEGDTLVITFNWEVKDSVICLFQFNKHGKRVDADAQYITKVDPSKMYLADAYNDEGYGKVCCYRRSGIVVGKY
jgi:hypothetical protein